MIGANLRLVVRIARDYLGRGLSLEDLMNVEVTSVARHPEKHADYSLQRFTEDWTTESPVKGPIVSHHVDISKTDGSGMFGSGIIVAVRVNGDHKLFMWYERKDGTLTEPAPHILQYD